MGDWIASIPGFTLEKYRKLKSSRLSLFTSNCFGGAILNRLGLPFLTPFINLAVSNEHFIKLLHNPHSYLKENLVYKGQQSGDQKNANFPIVACGDILIKMMHYKTFEEAVLAWNKRKLRINWDNIMIITATQSQEQLEKFDELPYDKKICFVPFKSDLNSAWHIDDTIDKDVSRFVDVYLNFARGKFFYYDWFDMLLYGKKTPLIDM